MPVVGVPVTPPPAGEVTVENPPAVAPLVSEADGQPVRARARGVEVSAGQAAVVRWVMIDRHGRPVDLAAAVPPGSVALRVREAFAAAADVAEAAGAVTDAGAGAVEATLPAAAVACPGVMAAEFAVLSAAGAVLLANPFYLIVTRSLFGPDQAGQGPPTVPEIRLHLRDSGPEDNYLLDAVEFDLAELAACIERPVQVWNETLEFVPRRYTTRNFPYRSRWLDAIVGYLHLLAAHNYDRNLQAYSAGGTSMQDKNKGPAYAQKGRAMIQEYTDWVKQRKGQLNLEEAYGSTSECF